MSSSPIGLDRILTEAPGAGPDRGMNKAQVQQLFTPGPAAGRQASPNRHLALYGINKEPAAGSLAARLLGSFPALQVWRFAPSWAGLGKPSFIKAWPQPLETKSISQGHRVCRRQDGFGVIPTTKSTTHFRTGAKVTILSVPIYFSYHCRKSRLIRNI